MASAGMQVFAFFLALFGVFGVIIATLLPNWKVNADVGSNIITAVIQMQGLWMDCTWYSTGMFSCTLKYSILSLPAYIQTSRTMMVLSCVISALGICISTVGMKCTRLGREQQTKNHAAVVGGICFLISGLLCLIPISWFTTNIISSFMDPTVPNSTKYEPGGAIYTGFVSAGFLFAGGLMFCTSCFKKHPAPNMHPPRKQQGTASQPDVEDKAGYSLQDYV
ncbi:claudin-20 [Protopterus annectens]|uniref:claudin-20 n=1 Tax=Protopterus annectens TaxID=7888 RepID=UPI001CFC45C1|nr:claudin-20 [Protopterus annectens]